MLTRQPSGTLTLVPRHPAPTGPVRAQPPTHDHSVIPFVPREPGRPERQFPPAACADPATDLASQRLSAQAGADREAMCVRHMPLVRYVVQSLLRHALSSSVLDYDDLVSYGVEGLIEAIDTFDPSYNVRFSTWAVMHIRTTIQDAIRELDPLPRSLRSRAKEFERVQHDLAHAHGRWPTSEEVARVLRMPLDRYRQLSGTINRVVVSLDQVSDTQDDEGHSWLSTLADDDPETDPEAQVDRIAMREALREALRALPEREHELLTLYYLKGMTMRDIARRLGISESRVSQVHARAVATLRTRMRELLEAA